MVENGPWSGGRGSAPATDGLVGSAPPRVQKTCSTCAENNPSLGTENDLGSKTVFRTCSRKQYCGAEKRTRCWVRFPYPARGRFSDIGLRTPHTCGSGCGHGGASRSGKPPVAQVLVLCPSPVISDTPRAGGCAKPRRLGMSREGTLSGPGALVAAAWEEIAARVGRQVRSAEARVRVRQASWARAS